MSSGTAALAAPVADINWDSLVSGGELKNSATSTATAAILIDAHTGEVLYDKSETQKMWPASITKIMSALIAIENTNLSDIVTIDNEIAEEMAKISDQGAAMCGFQLKETLTVEELLYGLLLNSGADAAIALAVHTAGGYDNFITMMNEKAQDIGMTDTHFDNPHGLHDGNHYTTAYDMAILTMEALKYPEFAKIVGTAKYTPTDTDKHTYSDDGIVWTNSNKLINGDNTYHYDYATGVKTGFTTPAQSTLVSSAHKGDQSLIAVVLHDTQLGKWKNSITMLEYGFKYYDTIDFSKLFGLDEIFAEVENAASSTGSNDLRMLLVPDKRTYMTDTQAVIDSIREDTSVFEQVVTYDAPLVAPIKKDAIVGKVEYLYLGEVVFTASLMAAEKVEAIPVITSEPSEEVNPKEDDAKNEFAQEDKPTNYVIYIAAVIAAVIILIILLLRINRRSKYSQYAHRKSKGNRSRAKHSAYQDVEYRPSSRRRP